MPESDHEDVAAWRP